MKTINCLLICAALMPAAVFAQSPASKIASMSNLYGNNDQVISKDEALKAGMPDAIFKKIDKTEKTELVKI